MFYLFRCNTASTLLFFHDRWIYFCVSKPHWTWGSGRVGEDSRKHPRLSLSPQLIAMTDKYFWTEKKSNWTKSEQTKAGVWNLWVNMMSNIQMIWSNLETKWNNSRTFQKEKWHDQKKQLHCSLTGKYKWFFKSNLLLQKTHWLVHSFF